MMGGDEGGSNGGGMDLYTNPKDLTLLLLCYCDNSDRIDMNAMDDGVLKMVMFHKMEQSYSCAVVWKKIKKKIK